MAANVENMFYTSNEQNGRFVPWHELGTPVSESPTSADAIKLAGLDWDVISSPVFTDTGVEIPGYKANTRSSDGKVLGIVSNKYRIVQNSEAFEFTDSLIGEEMRYETAGSLKGGKTIWLLAKMPQSEILGDKVDPYVVFTNTHDGTGAIKVACTPIRVVCNNTLNVALGSATRKWSTRHMGNIQDKLAEAQNTLELANVYMENLSIEAERFANTKITDDYFKDIVDVTFAIKDDMSDRQKRNIQEMKDNFVACYFAPDIAKFMGTGWGVINAAADFSSHYEGQRHTKTFEENRWANVMNGHYVLDSVSSMVTDCQKVA